MGAEGQRCELLGGCLFFNDEMDRMPKMADIYKRNYCLHDHSQCARFMVARSLGRSQVPADLFPNDRVRALDMLAAAGVTV